MRGWLVATIGMGCWLVPASHAGPPTWLTQGWQEYSPRERYEALQNYRRHERLPEQRREDVERKYERWRAMPEQERNRIRENYQRFQELSPEQRDRIEQHYRRGAE
jgi:hypothetical protein